MSYWKSLMKPTASKSDRLSKKLTRSDLWNQLKSMTDSNRPYGMQWAKSTKSQLQQAIETASPKTNPMNPSQPITKSIKSQLEKSGFKAKKGKYVYPTNSTEYPIKQAKHWWYVSMPSRFPKSKVIISFADDSEEVIQIANNKKEVEYFIAMVLYKRGSDNIDWHSALDRLDLIPTKATLQTPKKNSKKIGNSYDAIKGNCMVNEIELALHKNFPELQEKYGETGVPFSEFESIAKKVKKTIHVQINNELHTFNAAKKSKVINLMYLNNHIIAKPKFEECNVHRVDDLVNIESLLTNNNDKIKNITNILQVQKRIILIQTIQHKYLLNNQIFGENTRVPITKVNCITATQEYKEDLIAKNPIYPLANTNWKSIQGFARHGVKILKAPYHQGTTIDLKSAYTNYHTYPCYEGLPYDITFWVKHNPEHLNYILDNHQGFALVSWKSYYLNTIEHRWASIPHIKSRLAKGHKIEFHSWALSFAKGDLDRSMFEETPKRLWHHVIGSLCKTTSVSTITTSDPIYASTLGANKICEISNIPFYQKSEELDHCNNSYAHISAYIQAYTEIMMEDKYDDLQADNIDCWAIYVDGLSTKVNLKKYEDKFWSCKPNNKFFMTVGADIYDSSYQTAIQPEFTGEYHPIPVQGPSRIKVIEGQAGSGKSYLLRKIYNMIPNPKILVPNNLHKEIYPQMNVHTIDMHNVKSKATIPFVLLDEYTQMNNLPKGVNQILMFGNADQMSITPRDISEYDVHSLTTQYRFNDNVAKIAKEAKSSGKMLLDSIDIEDALLQDYQILAKSHNLIEQINDIALNLIKDGAPIECKVRWTSTTLSKNIYANDLGILKDGVITNVRTGEKYVEKVGRIEKNTPANIKKQEAKHNAAQKKLAPEDRTKFTPDRYIIPPIVYCFARTIYISQGAEYDRVCIITNWLSNKDKKSKYVAITRGKDINYIKKCILPIHAGDDEYTGAEYQ